MTAASGAGERDKAFHRSSNPTPSWRSPPVNTKDTPVLSLAQATCCLVENPPRERPGAWASWPPFFYRAGGVLMSAQDGRIDEHFLEWFIVGLLSLFPEPCPEVALLPTAKPLINGIPMAEFVGQVAPWGSGTRLVEDGFDEHSVAEPWRGAGGVFALTQ